MPSPADGAKARHVIVVCHFCTDARDAEEADGHDGADTAEMGCRSSTP